MAGAGVLADAPRAAAVEPAAPIGSVVISELANDGPGSRSDSFLELLNAGERAVDLSGWQIVRCSAQGLRGGVGRSEAALHGVVLGPGERFTVARVGTDLRGARPDAVFSQPFSDRGFGLLLVDAAGAISDAVGVYPNLPWPTTSECTRGANLPNSLNAALGESWQRVAFTGDAARDFVRARATPGAPNMTVAELPVAAAAGVRISELAAAGPGSGDDEFVELVNVGADTVELAGWRLLTCDAAGRSHADRPAAVFAAGTRLGPGARLVVATAGSPSGERAAAEVEVVPSPLRLAQRGHGVLLVDRDGARVDGVAASAYGDSACQAGDAKLTTEVDARTGESWQRVGDGRGEEDWVVGPRTPGTPNRAIEAGLREFDIRYGDERGVAVSELATDPGGFPGATDRRNFVELTNYGTREADLSGWRVVRCTRDGPRALGGGLELAPGTTLGPGRSWVAALEGTPRAATADAALAEAFDFRGTGVWIEDAAGRPIDSVGVYLANEMDFSIERPSPCTKGLSLTTFAPDRAAGETYQRVAFTGVDADDFAVLPSSPGDGRLAATVDSVEVATAAAEADAHEAVAAVELAAQRERRPGDDAGTPGATAATTRTSRTQVAAEDPSDDGQALLVLDRVVAGAAEAPLTARAAPGEVEVPTGSPQLVRDAGTRLPYLRFEATAPESTPGSTWAAVAWEGAAEPRTAVRLSAWHDGAWITLAEAIAGAEARVRLEGSAPIGSDRVVELLVQVVPRATTMERGASGGFDAASAYDVAISHLTDTQYLSEAYPETYAEAVAWIAANAGARKIGFATHTGDLVQNWVDADQHESLARREFEVASSMQRVLDDAGVPNSVLPGNHDNKRGITNELFNEYFGPDRYAGAEWYGESIASGDNSASYSTFARGGARFLMLSLPYGYGEREIAWAEGVVSSHPGHNVIVSTHEHVTPKDAGEPAHRSTSSRWLSRGGELWERVIAPNPNVVVVLSGHFHGVGRIVTEDAGGVEGHTVVEMLADYQEFRTHDGARATGFQRLLQFDLAGGSISVDAFTAGMGATASHPYDYVQFDPERGDHDGLSEMRPWNIVERGVQHRYSDADDEFLVEGIAFRYEKRLETGSVTVEVPDAIEPPFAATPAGPAGLGLRAPHPGPLPSVG